MRPKGSSETLETRGRIAGEMLKKKMGIRAVARLVHASPTSVLEWKRRLDEDGDDGLKARPVPGAPSWLKDEQKKALLDVLAKGAKASGYSTEIWTLERVAEVIKKLYEVSYHPSHIWRLLRAANWLESAFRTSQSTPRPIHGRACTTWPFHWDGISHINHLFLRPFIGRLNMTFDVAAKLKASRVILHSGYKPENELFKLQESWLKGNIAFWKEEIRRWAEAGIGIVLENDTEQAPDLLVQLVNEVDNPF
jgi:transposase